MTKDQIAKRLGAKKPVGMKELAAKYLELVNDNTSLKLELDEHKRLFEKQHDRSRDADLLWREANGQPDVSPDLGALLQWLIDRGDRWQAVVRAAKAIRVRFVMADAKQIKELDDLRHALDRLDQFYEGYKF